MRLRRNLEALVMDVKPQPRANRQARAIDWLRDG